MYTVSLCMFTMVLILDGCSEHVTPFYRETISKNYDCSRSKQMPLQIKLPSELHTCTSYYGPPSNIKISISFHLQGLLSRMCLINISQHNQILYVQIVLVHFIVSYYIKICQDFLDSIKMLCHDDLI